jgi:hypothetical protein
VETLQKRHLSPANAAQVRVLGGRGIGIFGGSYPFSRKQIAFPKYHPLNGPMSCSCAVETGFAGIHGDLVKDVRFGVKGGKMRTVILVTVEEITRY